MSRYIDANIAIKDARLNYGDIHDAINMEKFIKNQPTADVAPVIHAYWMNPHWCNSISCADCSNCHKTSYHVDYYGVQNNYKQCPYCGAIMNERTTNND